MMKRTQLWIATLATLAAVVGAIIVFNQAYAQKPTPSDDQVNAIARQLYCPVCENIPLDVCPTTACAQWRELIRTKLADGWNAQQIKDYFAQQYGDRVLGVPPQRGLNWILYILLPVSLIAGGGALFLILRGMRKKQPSTAEPATQVPGAQEDEYLKRIEEELNQRGAD
jgi:cytochrome c-type biogenesis protein CcmH